MTIKRVRHDTDPVHHVDHVVLRDHFGHELDLQIHPFVVRDQAGKPGEYELMPVDVEAEITKATELMKLRELAYFQHLVKRHPNHPLYRSYPEHPDNREQVTGDRLPTTAGFQQQKNQSKEREVRSQESEAKSQKAPIA